MLLYPVLLLSVITQEQPILNKMTDEQEAGGPVWTPSRMIERLGREIGNEESIYYWCAKVCHDPDERLAN